MWSPTHVQVVVRKAKNLRIKGKHGTNDTYVTIQLGKEKFQTSVQEKTVSPEWHEECELTIPDGNTSSISLSAYHRNFVGLDKFLGKVEIPLQDLDIYERPRNRSYQLRGKPSSGKQDGKERGELEVSFSFIVKSVTGSLMDLSKKPKKSGSLPLKMVHSVGGSLMNLAGKDKMSFSHLKNSISGKLSDKLPRKKTPLRDSVIEEHEPVNDDDQSYIEGDGYSDIDAMSNASSSQTGDAQHLASSQLDLASELDFPVVNSNVLPPTPKARERTSSQRSSSPVSVAAFSTTTTSAATAVAPTAKSTAAPVATPRNYTAPVEPRPQSLPSEKSENNRFLSMFQDDHVNVSSVSQKDLKPPVVTRSARRQQNSLAPKEQPIAPKTNNKVVIEQNRINVGSKFTATPSNESKALYEAMTKQELVVLLCKQRAVIERQQHQIGDLEGYIDNLLVRVMDTSPRILQNPYKDAPTVQ